MNLKDKSPLELGKMLCDSLMHTYEPQKLPPEGVLFYWQGVFLSGMERIYQKCGDKKYFNYIKDYADSVIGSNGELYGFCHELTTEDTPPLAKSALTMLDHKQATLILYNLYDETGDEKYIKAAKLAAKSMYFWPVNSVGGYWHMMTQHNQMWLDGAYMAGPISVIYAKRFGDTVLRERAIKQIFIMDDFMKDKNTGLYYHGWDESKEAQWADPETGLSAHIWGRALGWYTVAILDILEFIPKDHPAVERLSQIERDLLKALKKYQDEKTGMWYQVTDKPERADNWVESSCTNLFIYSYAKAIRMGVISKEEFGECLENAYSGINDRLFLSDDGYLIVDNVCVGTCIESGTYEHYINRDRTQNDLHGAGAFILMCSEMQNYRDFCNE